MKKTASKSTSTPSSDAPAYSNFAGLLTAKSRRTLPRGVKFEVIGSEINFVAKGVKLLTVSVHEFAKGELSRHGFKAAT